MTAGFGNGFCYDPPNRTLSMFYTLVVVRVRERIKRPTNSGVNADKDRGNLYTGIEMDSIRHSSLLARALPKEKTFDIFYAEELEEAPLRRKPSIGETKRLGNNRKTVTVPL